MAQPATRLRTKPRFGVFAVAILFALLGTACQNFYTDSLPTPQIALPTPVSPAGGGNSVELVEAAARAALAASLGIGTDAPSVFLLQGATWTDRRPGCYPSPSGVAGPYLVPGYRLLMQYEETYYEYDADIGGVTGALCESTAQLVPVEPALDTVVVNSTNATGQGLDTVYVLRSEDDVAEFNAVSSDVASVAVGVIDWSEEVLVGGWVDVGTAAEPVRAYRSPAGPAASSESSSGAETILIEVAIPADLPQDQVAAATDGPVQIWALVDITEPGSAYKFVVPE